MKLGHHANRRKDQRQSPDPYLWVSCEIYEKISASIQVRTLPPGCSDAGTVGPIAWNQRKGSLATGIPG